MDAIPIPMPYNCPALLGFCLPLSKSFKGVSFIWVSSARGWRWEGHLPAPEQGWSKMFAQHLWLQGVTGRDSLPQPWEVAWAKRPYSSCQELLW